MRRIKIGISFAGRFRADELHIGTGLDYRLLLNATFG